MKNCFELLGTQIPYDTIRSYRLIQREYIYRPCYMARTVSGFFRSATEYSFFKMLPYAAIIDEKDRQSALEKVDPFTMIGAIGKDLVQGAADALDSVLNPSRADRKRFTCVNTAGREFQTYLDEIPALLVREDGRASDVYKNDELYPLLGEPIAPAINMVYALSIQADESYCFYGNGIQVKNIGAVYKALKAGMEAYEAEQETRKALAEAGEKPGVPAEEDGLWLKIPLPKISISLPDIGSLFGSSEAAPGTGEEDSTQKNS